MNPQISRRSWCALAAATLAGCSLPDGVYDEEPDGLPATSETADAPAEGIRGQMVEGGGVLFDTNVNNTPQPGDTDEVLGTCAALLAPWAPTKPSDVMRAWDLLLDERWYGLSAELNTHDDGVCPARPDTWRSEGECTTSDGWRFTGSHNWRASSGGGAYQEFAAWALTHQDEGGAYEALADGRISTYVDRPEADEAVQFGLTFEQFRQRVANTGTYQRGSNATWLRDGGLVTSVMYWPVSGQVYLRIVQSDAAPSGDLCAMYSFADVPDCVQEPVGHVTFTGADVLVVTFDGNVACDGCGALTVDGVDAGSVCLGG